ncbi:TPA: S-type pyocin domain-containing protein [Pseudomonas putida]|nr:S-type pyocin domain-containing protein [Pseudomonas putida]
MKLNSWASFLSLSLSEQNLPLPSPASGQSDGARCKAHYTGVDLQPLEIKALLYPGEVLDANDLIITFPIDSGIDPVYLMFSTSGYHQPPKNLIAFPDAKPVGAKSSVLGGGKLRRRWVDSKGRIYEWDSQHGRVELYDKQGRHLGEFDSVSGNQTKSAVPGRTTEK